MSNIFNIVDHRWNNAGTVFNALLMGIDNGASGAPVSAIGSTFARFQSNNVDQLALAPGTAYATTTPAIYGISLGLLIGSTNQNLIFGATSAGTSHAILSNSQFTVQAGLPIGWSSSASDAAAVAADTTLKRVSQACIQSNGAFAATAPNTQAGTTYTMAATDDAIIFTSAAAVTVTLLAAASNTGRKLIIKQTGAGAVSSASSNVVALAGGAAGTAITTAAAKFAFLQSDGTNWIVLMSN